jgi:hypothetical protein
MQLIDLQEQAKLQAEVITLAAELRDLSEANPAHPALPQIARRIAQSSETLATLT